MRGPRDAARAAVRAAAAVPAVRAVRVLDAKKRLAKVERDLYAMQNRGDRGNMTERELSAHVATVDEKGRDKQRAERAVQRLS